MKNLNSVAHHKMKWAINVKGSIVEIPRVIIEEIRARPTNSLGWLNSKIRKAWRLEFPLTPVSAAQGFLHLTEPEWGMMNNPWWKFVAHCVTMMLGRGQMMELVRKTGWNLMEEAKYLLSFDECPTLNHCLVMNIITWNCRGALKPSFQNHVGDLVHNHDPTIMIIMETRIGGDRAKDINDRLPFNSAIHIDTIGFTGGLWILWNFDRVHITQLVLSEQEIHVLVKVTSSNFEFICTGIYASPRFHECCILWNNLKNVANLHNKPWAIAEDFNEVLVEEDKYRGRMISTNRSLLFKECLDTCNMVDLGFNGPRFTWTNRRDIFDLVQERIDRFFANPSWCTNFPNAKVTHLTHCLSDHCLVLLESNPSSGVHLPKPFMFHSFWLSDLSFLCIVSEAWGQALPLQTAIDRFAKKATDWNRYHFGNIFGKKKRIMARLNGIQKAMADCPSHSVVVLEKKLHREL